MLVEPESGEVLDLLAAARIDGASPDPAVLDDDEGGTSSMPKLSCS
jgi:hypothetical protein